MLLLAAGANQSPSVVAVGVVGGGGFNPKGAKEARANTQRARCQSAPRARETQTDTQSERVFLPFRSLSWQQRERAATAMTDNNGFLAPSKGRAMRNSGLVSALLLPKR